MLDLPAHPPQPLTVRASEIVEFDDVIWRIYSPRGPHPQAWNSFRSWGPAANMRWDPHPLPPGDHAEHAVYYGVVDVATCVCESFQRERLIDLTDPSPQLTGWLPTRPLRLLDLTGAWPTRNGGSGALGWSDDRRVTVGWARAIRAQLPEIEGILTRSTITQLPAVTLWGADARGKLPRFPRFDRPLTATLPLVVSVADVYGFGLAAG